MNERITKLFELKRQMDQLNATLKNLKDEYEGLSGDILHGLEEAGVDKMALSGIGSVTAKKEVVASVEDWDAFYKHIAENEAWYLLQRRVAVNACREEWNMGTNLPGVKPFEQKKLTVARMG